MHLSKLPLRFSLPLLVLVFAVVIAVYDWMAISRDLARQEARWELPASKVTARDLATQNALVTGTLVAGMSVLLWFCLHQLVTRRAGQIARVAARFGAGDLTARTGRNSSNELDRVGRAFDQMADQIERTQTRLRASEARLNQAQQIARLGNWSWEASGPMLWSTYMFDLFGLDRSIEPGLPAFLRAVHPEDRPRMEKDFESMWRSEKAVFESEYRVQLPSGEIRTVRGVVDLEREAGGRIGRLVGTAQDITELKLAEELKGRLETHLRQSQKMEALGTLAGGIAHDFNNILGAIMGNVELARMELPEDSPAQESLGHVISASCRARDLVKQILAFSRRQESARRPLQIQAIVHEAQQLLRGTLPPTVDIRVRTEPDCPPVLADASQIHQVLMNLCVNAAQAMPAQRGRIDLWVESVVVDEETALAHSLRPSTHVRLTVRDNGAGMDKRTLERVFEPFFTTKSPGQGTGLGLAVVHGIVRGHDGAVTVSSAPGVGATFQIYLPATGEPEGKTVRSPHAAMPGRGQRVLIVDDEAPLVSVFERTLALTGYRATGFCQPEEALAAVRADPHAFDVVLTDLTMPTMLGTDLAAELVRIREDLPIILVTGLGATLTVEAVRSRGIAELVSKPVTREVLTAAIQRVLAGREERSAKSQGADGIFPSMRAWWASPSQPPQPNPADPPKL